MKIANFEKYYLVADGWKDGKPLGPVCFTGRWSTGYGEWVNIDYFPLDKGDIEDNLSWMIGCDYFHSTDQIIQVKENDNADYLFKLISSIIYNTAVRDGPFYEFKKSSNSYCQV